MTLSERIKNYAREHFKLFRDKEKAVTQAYYDGYRDAVKAHWHECSDSTYDYPETDAMCALQVIVTHNHELWNQTLEIIFTPWDGNTWNLAPWDGERDMRVIAWAYDKDIL